MFFAYLLQEFKFRSSMQYLEVKGEKFLKVKKKMFLNPLKMLYC